VTSPEAENVLEPTANILDEKTATYVLAYFNFSLSVTKILFVIVISFPQLRN